MSTATFSSVYMDQALFSLSDVIETARERLAGVDFDTIVGTGFSGGIVIPALALAMDKKFVLIRKDGDDSHHGGGRLLGQLGERWIFVDDFISSGRTRTRVINKILVAAVGGCYGGSRPHSTQMVGQYLYVDYSDEGPHFTPFHPGWAGAAA